jgi:hypothetical protein
MPSLDIATNATFDPIALLKGASQSESTHLQVADVVKFPDQRVSRQTYTHQPGESATIIIAPVIPVNRPVIPVDRK